MFGHLLQSPAWKKNGSILEAVDKSGSEQVQLRSVTSIRTKRQHLFVIDRQTDRHWTTAHTIVANHRTGENYHSKFRQISCTCYCNHGSVLLCSITIHYVPVLCMIMVKVEFLYSAAYMITGPACFTISEVAADWQELMVLQRSMWPSTVHANGQLDSQCS